MVQFVGNPPPGGLMRISTDDFDAVFQEHGAKSAQVRAGACVLAREISQSLSSTASAREDICQGLCAFLLESLAKLPPNLKSPRAYLWVIGRRKGLDLLVIFAGRETAASDVDDDQGEDAVSVIESGEPVRRDERLMKPPPRKRCASPLGLIDNSMDRAKRCCLGLPEDSEDYRYLLCSIDTLQTLRYQLTGEFFPLSLPTVTFTKTARRSLDPL